MKEGKSRQEAACGPTQSRARARSAPKACYPELVCSTPLHAAFRQCRLQASTLICKRYAGWTTRSCCSQASSLPGALCMLVGNCCCSNTLAHAILCMQHVAPMASDQSASRHRRSPLPS